MSATTSPATTLHDVVVVHEQSRLTWRAPRATIENGRIIVPANPRNPPPDGMFGHPASTYDITALDGGDRVRRFKDVKAILEAKQYVFV
ncbi:MAG: hypothetical protein M3Q69_20365 [Acidobacteriota bacterium]|nr:hypothetical protein [Acidobacteriota bacterium]